MKLDFLILLLVCIILFTACDSRMTTEPIPVIVETALVKATLIPTETIVATETTTATPAKAFVVQTIISEKDEMTLVYVPAGKFEMGSESFKDAQPVQSVFVDSFWMDQTEVTNEKYARCVNVGGCQPPALISSYVHQDYFINPEFGDHPVINVTWNDALSYCTWAGRRLPTEAEWEKTSSWNPETQTKTLFPWGETIDCSKANYWGKQNGCAIDMTPVGSYEEDLSLYGALDLAGNAREWVSSLYLSYPYDPSDGREDLTTSGSRVMRGGSRGFDYSYFGAAYRFEQDPTTTKNGFGFRCALSSFE